MRIHYDAAPALGREFIELVPEVVAAITLTVTAGWERACTFKDVNPDTGEVFVTERLRDGMRAALKQADLTMIVVLPGTESRSMPSVVIPDGRTDIPLLVIEVFLRTQEHDPHAIIECKRIAGTDTYLCREYVVEGIDRFASGKYAENHAWGFMVGYLLNGTAGEAAQGVNAYLARVARSADRLVASDTEDAPLWRSRHERASPSRPIELHHTFLQFADMA